MKEISKEEFEQIIAEAENYEVLVDGLRETYVLEDETQVIDNTDYDLGGSFHTYYLIEPEEEDE